MNKFFVTLLLLFLTSSIFAITCNPGFVDTLTIRSLDSNLRPLSGTSIIVRYQIDSTTGKGYFTSNPVVTNATGVINFVARNREQLSSKVDCNIQINASFNGTTISNTISAMEHPSILDFKFNSYILTVQVVDQKNQPLSNAQVLINGIIKQTDSNGIVFLQVPKGSNRVVVSFDEGKQERLVDVQNDVLISFNIGFYPLNVSVVDDNSNPLENVRLNLNNQNYYTDSNGQVSIQKIFGGTQTLVASIGKSTKSFDLDLSLQNQLKIIFDTNAPKILNIKNSEEQGLIKISFDVDDQGLNPSGIPSGGVVVTYQVDGGALQKAPIFVRNRNTYVAEIKQPAQGSLIEFTIDVSDKEENKRSVAGRISVVESINPVSSNVTNVTGPTSSNNNQIPFSIPIEIIAGILIILVVIYLLFRFRGEQN